MINKVINKEKQKAPSKSEIGYVLCTDDTDNSSVQRDMIYALSKDTYTDDGNYYVDLIINGSTLRGFYASRFEHISTEELEKYLKDSSMSILKDFK